MGCKADEGAGIAIGHPSRPQECERAKTPSQTDVPNAPRALLASPQHPRPPVSLQTGRCARAPPQTPARAELNSLGVAGSRCSITLVVLGGLGG